MLSFVLAPIACGLMQAPATATVILTSANGGRSADGGCIWLRQDDALGISGRAIIKDLNGNISFDDEKSK